MSPSALQNFDRTLKRGRTFSLPDKLRFAAWAHEKRNQPGIYRALAALGWKGKTKRDDASIIMARYVALDAPWRGRRIAWQSAASNSIAYSKRLQYQSKAAFTKRCGCRFSSMRIMPETFSVKNVRECERFAAYAGRDAGAAAKRSWLVKQSASSHGKLIKYIHMVPLNEHLCATRQSKYWAQNNNTSIV